MIADKQPDLLFPTARLVVALVTDFGEKMQKLSCPQSHNFESVILIIWRNHKWAYQRLIFLQMSV